MSSIINLARIKQLALLLLLLVPVASLASCEQTTTPVTVTGKITKPSVYVLNEGGFTKKNASLDARSLSGGNSFSNLVPGLGDAGNDIQIINGNLYVVLNGSGNIDVLTLDSAKKLDSIPFTSGQAPNQIKQISSTEAWATQLYNPNVAVIDLQSSKVTGVINVGAGNVGIAKAGTNVFVTSGSDSLVAIDAGTRAIVKTIKVGDQPQNLFYDAANDQLIIQCFGNFGVTASSIFWVKASTMMVTDSTRLGTGDFIGNIILGSSVLYALDGDHVTTINLASHQIASAKFISGTSYYNGAVDAVTNELSLGTANGYKTNGTVDVYDATSGALSRSFTAGIAPAHFAFYR
jgi:YVTN family beta-propeller protein